MKKYIRQIVSFVSITLLAVTNCISTGETLEYAKVEHSDSVEDRVFQTDEVHIVDYDEYNEISFTAKDVEMLAKTVWGEARGCAPDEQRLVVWTVLQRVDNTYWDNAISEVIKKDNQFVGYCDTNPIDEDIYQLCYEEFIKWRNNEEVPVHEVYAPTVPYYFFTGDGKNNWFSKEWK